jgi:hypothetical protein
MTTVRKKDFVDSRFMPSSDIIGRVTDVVWEMTNAVEGMDDRMILRKYLRTTSSVMKISVVVVSGTCIPTAIPYWYSVLRCGRTPIPIGRTAVVRPYWRCTERYSTVLVPSVIKRCGWLHTAYGIRTSPDPRAGKSPPVVRSSVIQSTSDLDANQPHPLTRPFPFFSLASLLDEHPFVAVIPLSLIELTRGRSVNARGIEFGQTILMRTTISPARSFWRNRFILRQQFLSTPPLPATFHRFAVLLLIRSRTNIVGNGNVDGDGRQRPNSNLRVDVGKKQHDRVSRPGEESECAEKSNLID